MTPTPGSFGAEYDAVAHARNDDIAGEIPASVADLTWDLVRLQAALAGDMPAPHRVLCEAVAESLADRIRGLTVPAVSERRAA